MSTSFFSQDCLRRPLRTVQPNEEMLHFTLQIDLHTARRVRVVLARKNSDNSRVVLKIYEKAALSEAALAHLQRSIIAHAELCGHPHILEMHEVIESPLLLIISYEYCSGGDVFNLIEVHGRLPPEIASSFVLQISRAVSYMHSRGYVHRDLKPENVMLTGRDQGGPMVKLGDFDLATRWTPNHVHTRWCGTTQYAAPELLSRRCYLGPEVDSWSLGVTFYVLLMGVFPFHEEFYRSRGESPAKHLLPLSSDVPSALKDLIMLLLEHSAEKRSTVLAFRRGLAEFVRTEYRALTLPAGLESDPDDAPDTESPRSTNALTRTSSSESFISVASSVTSNDSDDQRPEYLKAGDVDLVNLTRSAAAKQTFSVRRKLQNFLSNRR